tara:strand:+ start:1014 stop:1307 length:294 start_codon:yes stop_codon:yes gene_type:complete
MKYQELIKNPPILEVEDGAREVIFTTVSVMCDNKKTLKLHQNLYGDFKLSGNGSAISNWQMKFENYEIEWCADKAEWAEVIKMINSGTARIEKIKSR